MPKEVLLEIIKNGLYLNLLLISITHFVSNSVYQKLVLRLNNCSISLKKITPFVIAGTIYTLTGKQFIPNYLFGIVSVILFAFFAYLIHKMSFLRLFFTSLAVMLLSVAGSVGIIQPLVLYNKNFLLFLTETPLGVAIGSLLEITFPTIILLLLSFKKIHPFASNSKVTLLDFLGIILFALTFLVIYYLAFLFVWLYQYQSNSTITTLVLELLLFFSAGIILFYIFRYNNKKQSKQLEKLTAMEHSNQLIETIYSERREYQNNLQVMKIMAAMGVTQELEAYMTKVIKNMLRTGNITKINDPILIAAIITHQVKAKEYNIAVTVNCHKPLSNIDDISLKLGEVFNIFLDLLIENILAVKEAAGMIIIDIEERPAEYSFDFKTTEAAFFNRKKPLEGPGQIPDYPAKLATAKNLIKELNGNFYPIIHDGQIMRLKVTISKNLPLSGILNSNYL